MANPVVQTYSYQSLLLAELVATGNLLDGAKLHLATSNAAITSTSVLADITEATWHGYAPATIIWGAVFINPSTGMPTVTGSLTRFTATSVFSSPGTNYSWYITDSGSTVLYLARRFDAPITISAAGQVIEVVPSVPLYIPV